jgi:hypothetical protein
MQIVNQMSSNEQGNCSPDDHGCFRVLSWVYLFWGAPILLVCVISSITAPNVLGYRSLLGVCLATYSAACIWSSVLLRRQLHLVPMIVACLSMILIPIGTIIGLTTIIMLRRPSIRGDPNHLPPSAKLSPTKLQSPQTIAPQGNETGSQLDTQASRNTSMLERGKQIGPT